MATDLQTLSAPFDAIARQYDDVFTCSAIGRAQRLSVWRKLESTFRPGDRVLEIGCGTGVDACFLGELGVQVLATDSSPEMISIASHRVRKSGLESFVQARLLAAEDIGILPAGERFDGAFSNFGAVNCIHDIDGLALRLARVLRPGAKVLTCFLGDCCLWEMAWYLGRGNAQKAFRRFAKKQRVQVAEGNPVQVHYRSVRELALAFAPHFVLRSLKGVGVLVPPSYVERRASQFPRLLRAASWADSWVERCPGIRRFGDHILIEFERGAA